MTFIWKHLYHQQKNYEGLNQWAFVPLGKTLTYTTSNLNSLQNSLESNQCIDCDELNHKNRHSIQELPQYCGGSKYVCPVWNRSHWCFSITRKDKFQDQCTLIQLILYAPVKNHQNMNWTKNLKAIRTCIGITVHQDIKN